MARCGCSSVCFCPAYATVLASTAMCLLRAVCSMLAQSLSYRAQANFELAAHMLFCACLSSLLLLPQLQQPSSQGNCDMLCR